MEKIKFKKEVALVLNDRQIDWLLQVFQNPLLADTGEYDNFPKEDEENKEMRLAFFEALQDIKERHFS